jgi:N-methylhydantoinase B
VVLRKTSFSANIKERRDYSCAVYDARGETVAMGDHMPVIWARCRSRRAL